MALTKPNIDDRGVVTGDFKPPGTGLWLRASACSLALILRNRGLMRHLSMQPATEIRYLATNVVDGEYIVQKRHQGVEFVAGKAHWRVHHEEPGGREGRGLMRAGGTGAGGSIVNSFNFS